MAELLRGGPVATEITEELQARVARLALDGVAPGLAMVRVGERPDDLSYERAAMKRAEKVGVEVRRFVLPDSCSQDDLRSVIQEVNDDSSLHGCLLFRPLPAALDETAACAALDPAKDVDGITPGSLYGVFAGQPVGFPPCTAQGVVELLVRSGVELAGARVTVVGRSLVIGRPVAMMLQAHDATVTMCHTRTRDLAAECRRADVLVVAAGHAATVGADAVSGRQTVVDVGINWDDEAGKLVGDVDFDAVVDRVARITPVPGGVGAVTTAVLMSHVVEAAERAAGHHAAG
ncbi:bifunctional 5,10-methylenetetrahydrofolate dehydrogenase/5,10-methenyltetrahydrofolate cyclohydrolase [Enorma phocaeensis]|uniref:bifunctional 5,10-methylenetetrahydrofolate dehydrogenase/5,10-methenyltetrahydrofolate cyclohydrolase n=1 Tax=Enorma phocaeensis TaxID=1871019 RepID=UPI001959F1CC|nr:bifunctional 5,10-methylenetetrahydrofolate dehydrogenase/5,10-methenyltetrahydrofolate cyclohydrolase [Enorma phocaeensis]MBM6952379.1 bifunctional 5,10-methylenetetrahydrofolate dehydrogenase/5,10-methenyltetrahydrofolate cyclohydrolase [Enorma phocaeensis]